MTSATILTTASGLVGLVSVLSIGTFSLFRKECELKARLPTMVYPLVCVDIILLVLIVCNETQGLSCEFILWSGNIWYVLHAQLIGTRCWAMTILFNRELRNRFFWATKPCCILVLAAFGIAYTIFHTAFTQAFYIKTLHTRDIKCHFLLPWWNYLCVFSSNLLLAFLWYSKIETKPIEKINDNFGIYREVKLLKHSAFFILLYVICSQLCESGILQEKMPLALLLMLNIFVVAILAVTSPALMVLLGKLAKLLRIRCQTHCKVTSIKVIPVVEFPDGCIAKMELNTVSQILADDNCAKQFRAHSQRHWCAENVDFCLEVSRYKSLCDPENMITSIYECYTCFTAIVEEFVKDGAPCEVNLSGRQKAAILKVKNLQTYQDFGHARTKIFDEAQQEIQRLLKENLLCSFVAQSRRKQNS